ncbi:MAG: hypothetical protein U0031_20145 [Thermomicrobiales bacterium]
MGHEARVFAVDDNEIERYARAIAHIANKGLADGSEERQRAVNTYGTAFQMLVMRRGADYGRALAMAAGNRALGLVIDTDHATGLVDGDLSEIHERVCVAEEEAQARALAEEQDDQAID